MQNLTCIYLFVRNISSQYSSISDALDILEHCEELLLYVRIIYHEKKWSFDDKRRVKESATDITIYTLEPKHNFGSWGDCLFYYKYPDISKHT